MSEFSTIYISTDNPYAVQVHWNVPRFFSIFGVQGQGTWNCGRQYGLRFRGPSSSSYLWPPRNSDCPNSVSWRRPCWHRAYPPLALSSPATRFVRIMKSPHNTAVNVGLLFRFRRFVQRFKVGNGHNYKMYNNYNNVVYAFRLSKVCVPTTVAMSMTRAPIRVRATPMEYIINRDL